MGWLIAGGILGGLILLIAVILSLPLHICLKSDENGEFLWRGRLLFFTFKKSANATPNSDSAARKTVEKLFGLSKFSSSKKLRESISDDGISFTVSQFADVLLALVGRVLWLLPRCRVHRLALRVVCADADGGDAAMNYGTVCAVLYPLVGFVQNKLRLKKHALQLDVRCDFDSEQSDFAYDIRFSVTIWQILRALLFIVKKNVEREIQP